MFFCLCYPACTFCLAGKNTLNSGEGNAVPLERKSALKFIYKFNFVVVVVAAFVQNICSISNIYVRECIDGSGFIFFGIKFFVSFQMLPSNR